jgi:hypothetical protein
MSILAIDPGRTSGICDSESPEEYFVLQMHEFDAIDYIESVAPQLIIMEKFVIQKRPNIDAFPLELIGCIHRYCTKSKCVLVEQMPSNIKGVQDEMLKRCGLWVPGYPHGQDAMKHMVFYYLGRAPFDDKVLMMDVIAGRLTPTVNIAPR